MDHIWDERFAGIDRLYGRGALARFRQCRVAVIGLGGVGSWAAEALARTGGNAAEAARLLGQVGRGLARDPGGTVRAMIRRLGR